MTNKSKTRIVLLPGFHGTADLFDSFLKQCPPAFDPLVVSYPRDRALSYEALASEVRNRIRGDSPVVLLGESFSGPVALRLAAEGLEGLTAVVLVGTFVLPPAPRWTRFLPWKSIFHARTPLYLARAFAMGSPEAADVIRRAGRTIQDVSADALASRVHAALTVDARPWLRSCPVPILYLAGAQDRLVRRRCLDSIQRCRPDVVCRTLQTPHFILQLAPTQAWKAITEFIQGDRE